MDKVSALANVWCELNAIHDKLVDLASDLHDDGIEDIPAMMLDTAMVRGDAPSIVDLMVMIEDEQTRVSDNLGI